MRPFTKLPLLIAALALSTVGCSRAEDIGSVSTNFRITGSDKIVIEAFDDPLVQGVTCYVSR
ncbi:CREA signal peptide protein, partial [Escherichia coli]|nr:CREA signal peptide protein [Escherichia coli]